MPSCITYTIVIAYAIVITNAIVIVYALVITYAAVTIVPQRPVCNNDQCRIMIIVAQVTSVA